MKYSHPYTPWYNLHYVKDLIKGPKMRVIEESLCDTERERDLFFFCGIIGCSVFAAAAWLYFFYIAQATWPMATWFAQQLASVPNHFKLIVVIFCGHLHFLWTFLWYLKHMWTVTPPAGLAYLCDISCKRKHARTGSYYLFLNRIVFKSLLNWLEPDTNCHQMSMVCAWAWACVWLVTSHHHCYHPLHPFPLW